MMGAEERTVPYDRKLVGADMFATACSLSEESENGWPCIGEHGIGCAKKDYLKKFYGDTPISIMQGIKK